MEKSGHNQQIDSGFSMVTPWWRGCYGTTQLLQKDGATYVLSCWNGELYSDCYRSDLHGVPLEPKETFSIKPVKKTINGELELYELSGYEISKS